ncbi:hypothetical protein ACWZJV_26660 [Nocardioides sp. WG-D5]
MSTTPWAPSRAKRRIAPETKGDVINSKVELSGWADFQRLARADRISWDWDTNSDGATQYDVLGRSAARWHLAANLQGVQVTGADSRTEKGYHAGLIVVLAYSALEHLEDQAIHKRKGAINNVTIPDPSLADRLRSGTKTHKLLTSETIVDPRLRAKLRNWEAGHDSDVLVVAKALRHMFAHGAFTPYGLDITKTAARNALTDLAEAVRVTAQDRFITWLAGHRR